MALWGIQSAAETGSLSSISTVAEQTLPTESGGMTLQKYENLAA